MIYYVFTLKFLAPVHFGDTASGGNLDRMSLSCSADTLFAALCNEAAASDADLLQKLIQKVSDGQVKFSSLFPYYRTKDGEEDLYMYLPKPLLQMDVKEQTNKSFSEMRQLATKLKKQKKTSYIRACQMQEWLHNSSQGIALDYEVPEFAVPFVSGKVNLREAEPLPYYVGSYLFAENTGLYFICGVEDEDDMEWLEELLVQLGMSGIGGKRSSGYGKFKLADNYMEIESKDLDVIYDMLFEEDSNIQMCLSPVCPLASEIEIVKTGAYKLLKRGGFISSPDMAENIKRDSVYMLAEGSCFDKRLQGQVLSQSVEGLAHKLYRDGVGMFVGLKDE